MAARMARSPADIAILDPSEEHFWIPNPRDGLSFFRRYLPPGREARPLGRTVLYVHGGTFRRHCRSRTASAEDP